MSAQLKVKLIQLNVSETFVVIVSNDTIYTQVNQSQSLRMVTIQKWKKESNMLSRLLEAQVKAMYMKMLIVVIIC